ncbi:NADH-quinone oxidoreductase subunit N [Verrucomicrobium sp. BvORR034]|uniref:NADH-quinone oxidoreductase subunit N n=1 Tax=Verrucomicrobium sp. BvORR034 TaxID=1396418 RepID=UPI000679D446|nr:NADH-quinone oxidoreductase subunit N [Verrucomicrobium sp. BvORR034]
MSPLSLELGLGLLGLVLLLVESFASVPRKLIAYAAIGGLLAALAVIVSGAAGSVPDSLKEFYVVDPLALFYKGFAIIATLATIILSLEYAPIIHQFVATHPERTKEAGLGEFYSLPLFVCVGMMVMASAVDLITIFVALELVTVSFYVLVAFMRRSAASLEAGVKYLILGALSTGLLVYGMSWLYGMTGELSLSGVAYKLAHWEGNSAPILFAVGLMLAGLAFKVGAVPFHIWIPDVYQGAPTPVTAFLSVGSKAAGFVVLTRIVGTFLTPGSVVAGPVIQILLILGGATILLGNLAAIAQTNFKRLLGYSSIAHAGYLLVALACIHTGGLKMTSGEVAAFYLATYLPMTFVCFLILSAMRAKGYGEDIASLKGLGRANPTLGLALAIALASLAGLPLTAGFMGKFFVIFATVLEGYYTYLAIAVIGAATGFFYYFKVILAVYSKPDGPSEGPTPDLGLLSKVSLAVFVAAILVVGVYPDLIRFALVK